jgi:homogentisate phytyltransferase/homogentisate geranylgeranyltransferase
VLPFAFAIAVLKDVPDAEGDRRHRIATFTVRLGPRAAFLMGIIPLAGAYLAMIVAAPLLLNDASAAVLVAGHLVCLAVLLWLALSVDLTDRVAFTRFYMRVWTLFFAEYLLMPLAVVVA